MPRSTEDIINAYRRHYQATRDSVQAWNLTLDEIAGPFTGHEDEATGIERGRVADVLQNIQDKLLLELNDPFAVAVEQIMEQLRQWDIVGHIRREYADFLEINAGGAIRERRQDWKPGSSPAKTKEEMEKFLETVDEYPTLYVMMTDKGGLAGYQIEMPSFWRGHGGPVAAVVLSDATDYADIESEVAEALAQEDIDWDAKRR